MRGVTQQQALDLLNRWGGQPLPLNASCWVRDDTATPVRDFLFVRLRGAVAAVKAAGPRLIADMQALGGEVRVMDNFDAGADWTACRDQTLPFFHCPSPETGPVAPERCHKPRQRWHCLMPSWWSGTAASAGCGRPRARRWRCAKRLRRQVEVLRYL